MSRSFPKWSAYAKPRARMVSEAAARLGRRGMNLAAARSYALPAGYGRRNRIARVKGAIAPYGGRRELKYVDTTLSNLACDTTGSVTALNLLAVGDDNTSRDGRQVTIKSVQLKGLIAPLDGDTNAAKGRLLIVWDNAVNSGTIATIAQILTSATSFAFPLVDNANRFTILWDSNYAVGGGSTVATQSYTQAPQVFSVDYYRKIDQVTQYSGTTAAIGSIQNGGLLLVTVGSQGAGLGPAFNGQARVRFTDD